MKLSLTITTYPVDHAVGDSWNYLAQVPVEDYGPCVTSEETQLTMLTDNYSISAIKVIRFFNYDYF